MGGLPVRAETKVKWAAVGLVGFCFLCALLATAQAQDVTIAPGEKYVIDWTQEALCTNGAPIAECPITGYHVQIERDQSKTVWNNVSTAPLSAISRSYTWTANGSGQTCFRVNVLNANGYEQSPPSNIHCVRVVLPLKPGAKPPVVSGHKLDQIAQVDL